MNTTARLGYCLMVIGGATLGGSLMYGVTILGGCQPAGAVPTDPRPLVSDVANTTKSVAADVGSRATDIDSHTITIQRRTPVSAIPAIAPEVAAISVDTAALRTDQGQLQATTAQLAQVTSEVTALQGDNAKLTTANQKLESDNASKRQTLMLIMTMFGIAGLAAAGVFMYLGNMSLGIMFAIGGAITVGLSLAVAQFAVWIGLGSIVLLIGGIAYLAYTKYTASKAASEIVQTTEAAKMMMAPEHRRSLFGNGPIPGVVHQLQSPSTQAIVAKVRARIPLAPYNSVVPLVAAPPKAAA